jgi:flagellar hook-basal body complex protein FliE
MIDRISLAARSISLEAARHGAAGGGLVSQGAGGTSFGETLRQAIGRVSEAQENSAEQVGAFLRGEHVELHQVMAAAEEAGIALEMLIEVRNKFTEAYRTVINMQS